MKIASGILALLFLSAGLALSQTAGTRVAVFADLKDLDLEDLCVAALSSNKGIELLDRRQLTHLLGEKVLAATFAGTGSKAGAGRLAGVDLIVALRRDGHAVDLEIVECSSGKILSQGNTTIEKLGRSAVGLLKEAVKREDRPVKPSKVAVEDFRDGKGINYRLPAEIRDGLVASGFEVLDRSIVEHAAAEHELAKSGFASHSTDALAGADYLVRGQIHGDQIHVQLLDARKGRMEASYDFETSKAQEAIVHLLKDRNKNLKASPASILEPRVQIEALIPLYEGIKHYRDGNLPVALSSFWKAELLDDKFVQAIEWEARCYAAMNLPIFADAVRRYARECLVGRGVSVPSSNIPADGITFLGIQDSKDQPLTEMKAVDALARIAPGKIVLPDDLASYRQEYDSIVGGSDNAWLRAPGFLTRWSLRVSPKQDDKGKLEWTLFDTLSGTIRSTATTTSHPGDSWNRSLGELVRSANRSAEDKRGDAGSRILLADAWSLESITDEEEKNNLELLRALAITPANPSFIGKTFHGLEPRKLIPKKDFTRKYSVEENFLNYALKETLRQSLPKNDPYRAWLELDKIASFLKYDLSGLLYSGEQIDPMEALKKFVESHPDDAPGAFARYMLLIDTMDAMEPKDRVKACTQTVDALRQANVQGAFEKSKLLLDCSIHLETLARLVAGETEHIDRLPGGPFPRAARPDITLKDGKVGIQWVEDWLCNEWDKVTIPKENWKQEAIAAIHILGRGSHGARIPPSWLEESHDSLVLLIFCEKAAREAACPYGLPDKSPIDAKADRENYRRTLDYFIRNIPLWLNRVTKGSELMFLAQETDQFLKHLSYYAYSSTLSDQEFYTIQKTLYQAVVAAAERIGENPKQYTDDYWPVMPRWVSPAIWNAWESAKAYMGSYEQLSGREIASAAVSFAESPTQKTDWWAFMSDSHGLNSEKYTEFAFRHLGGMNELYHPDDLSLAPMLGEREAAFLFNYGSILFNGRYYPEAEPWFRLVASMPDGPLLSTKQSREIRENARLYKARCLQKEGRLSEALTLALGSVKTASAELPPMRFITHVWPSGSGLRFEYDGFLNTVGMRLVRDIRLLSSTKELPDNLHIFQIPLKGAPGNDDKATFFLRVPPGLSTSSTEKLPLLVITPSFNHSGAEYLLESNAWARFADEYGICLLMPEFEFANERPGGGFEYEQAASWSGQTLLEAVKWIGDRYSVNTDRILIHGYGGGGIFASGFVRWAPERCLAASLSSFGNNETSADGCLAMKPFSEICSVPLLITCGDRDDARLGIYNRRMITERYAAEAKAAGVDVEWNVLPNTGHVPTQEMEKTVQDFFVRKAHLTKRKP
jgi:hypothetical protein